MSATAPIPGAPTPNSGLPDTPRHGAIVVIVIGMIVSVIDGTIVNLALPGIARDLNVGAADTVWVVNAYLIAIVGLLLPCAALGDIYGYRRVHLVGTAVFTLASIASFLATSLPMLVAARALQGVGAAGLMAVNTALVRLSFPPRMLARGLALNSMVVAASTVAGPSAAAAILSVADWPWLFAPNLPAGALVLALGWRALPSNATRPPADARLAPLDAVLNVGMFALIFLGVSALGTRVGAGSTSAFSTTQGLLLLGAGVLIGAFYVRRQARLAMPVFAVDLLRIRVFALSMCTSVCSFTAQTIAFVGLPFLMIDHWRHTPTRAAVLITAWPIAVVATAPLAARLIGRVPSGLLGSIGLGILSIGLAALALLSAQPQDADIVWRMALCGIGFGLFQSPNNHTIVTAAPPHRAGAAGGMLGTARLTGQSVGAVLLTMVFSLAGTHDARGPEAALLLAAGFAAVAAVFSGLRVRG